MQDNFIAPVREHSFPQFPKVGDMRQRAVVQNQPEEQATVVKKAPSKPRKSQRFTRTVYELTVASVFENVRNQSRAMTLANQEEAKAQELADTADPEGQRADAGEDLVEAMLVRKMQAKTEKGLKDDPSAKPFPVAKTRDRLRVKRVLCAHNRSTHIDWRLQWRFPARQEDFGGNSDPQ